MVNYNNHFSSTTGVGNFRAQLDVADYTDIASWTAAFTNSSEVSSLNVDPIFINANGNLPADFNKSVITNGVAISGYNLDFFSVSRNNPPQMGAIENNIPCGVITVSIDSIHNVTCFNGNDGYADLTASGGVSPYNYSWSNSLTGEIQNSLTPGNYTITATDNLGCFGSINIGILWKGKWNSECNRDWGYRQLFLQLE
jgi:hypothetical protein